MIESVKIAGIYGWQSFEFSQSIEEPAAAFSVQTSASPAMDTPDTIRQKLITVTANDDLLLTGYIDQYSVQGDAQTRSNLSISGRSKTADIIDSQTSGSFRQMSGLQIIKKLAAPYGIEIETDSTDWNTHEAFTVASGSTVMRAIHNVLQLQQKCCTVTATGQLKIYNAESATFGGSVGIGGRIESFSINYDDTQRFSDISAKAQDASFFEGRQASEIIGKAFDNSIRYRTRMIYPRGDMTTPRAKEAAIRYAKRALGRGVTASVQVTGWRNKGGGFYAPNQKLMIEIPSENIAAEMVISSVRLSQNLDNGTVADLELKPIAAFDATSSKGVSAPSTRVAGSSAEPRLLPSTAQPISSPTNTELNGIFDFSRLGNG